MARGRKSALADLIRTGLVADGELLRYKSKQGQLLAIGRAREGGIEVDGAAKLLGYTAFEDTSGSKYHRPAEHTHTSSSRTLQGLALLAADADGGGGGAAGGRGARHGAAAAADEPAVELLKDENDDLCYVCGLGGDLVCCEACPAVFHAACLGLAAPPEGDFYCPHCRCDSCNAGGNDGVLPTGCSWLDCQHFTPTSTPRSASRPHISAARSGAAKAEAVGGAEPMQLDGVGGGAAAGAGAAGGGAAEGEATFAALDSCVSGIHGGSEPRSPVVGATPPEAAEAAGPAAAAAAAASEAAAVYCPVSCRWSHLRCFPPEFAQALRQQFSRPCISSAAALACSARLAAACAAGLLPVGSIAEGGRAAAAAGGAEAAPAAVATGGSDAAEQGPAAVQLSLLVVQGAAVASPGDCRGHAPSYSAEQRGQLRTALSAALHLLRSCYEPLPDSRTGADMLPWLLRGAVLAGGDADYSGVHTALLYAGPAVVGAAVFRCFGDIAELPVLAVRPELQRRNGLGRLLLAAVERLLLLCGAKVLLTPAFTASGLPYLAVPPPPAGQPQPQQPALLQAKWGYSLAQAATVLAACRHPLVRMPGVQLACKQLSAGTLLQLQRLPRRLQWSGHALDVRQLLKEGRLAGVASPAPAAAVADSAAGGEVLRRKPGRPPKAAIREPTTTAAPYQQLQPQQQQQQPPPQGAEQQRMLAVMYQQQVLAQQAAAAAVAGQQLPAQQMTPAMLAAYQQMLLQQQQPEAYAHMLLQQQQLQAAMLAQQQQQQRQPALQQQQQQQPVLLPQGQQAEQQAPPLTDKAMQQ